MVKVPKVLLKILKVIALCPVVRVIVEIAQIFPVRLLPVGNLRFHDSSMIQAMRISNPNFHRLFAIVKNTQLRLICLLFYFGGGYKRLSF